MIDVFKDKAGRLWAEVESDLIDVEDISKKFNLPAGYIYQSGDSEYQSAKEVKRMKIESFGLTPVFYRNRQYLYIDKIKIKGFLELRYKNAENLEQIIEYNSMYNDLLQCLF